MVSTLASIGLLLGAAVVFAADWAVSRGGGRHRKRSGSEQSGGSGVAIAIGALMDGIPESAAIGISLLQGSGVSVALVAAVFLSNLPEGLSAVAGMRRAGRPASYVLGLWGGIVAASVVAALLGYLVPAGA